MLPPILLALAMALPARGQGRGSENEQAPARANPIVLSKEQQDALSAYAPSALQQLMRMFLAPPTADGADVAVDSGRVSYTPPAGYRNPPEPPAAARAAPLEASAGPGLPHASAAPDRLRPRDFFVRPQRPPAAAAAGRGERSQELAALARRLNQGGSPGDYALAEKAAREAVALGPSRAEPREQLSWSLFRQRRYAEAFVQADGAVARGPRRPFAHYLLALALERQDRRADMIKELEAAARLDPAAYSEALRRVRLGEELLRPNEEDNWPLFGALSDRADDPAAPTAWAGAALGLAILLLALGRLSSAGSGDFKRKTGARLSQAVNVWRDRRARLGHTLRRRLESLADYLWKRRTWPPARPAQSASGLLGGKYKLIRTLGPAGGPPLMQALDTSLGRSVAARVVWPGSGGSRPEALARAKAAAALTHPNLADVYEVLDTGPRVWVVSEYAPGRPLSGLIRAQGPLPAALALDVASQVLRALACAHEAGLAHGALEPSHILIGAQGHVKLIHFGLARRGPPPKHPYSDAEGADPFAGDVQALGTCLYEALTGRHPLSVYDGQRRDGRRFPSVRASRRELPPALDELVDRMLGGAGVPSARSALDRLSRCARVLA